MRQSKKILAGVVCLIFFIISSAATKAHAMIWERKGQVRTRAYQEIEEDNAYEDAQGYNAQLRLENTFVFPDNDIAIQINGEVRYDAFVGDQTDDDADILIKEAFVDLQKEHYSLRVGRQTITWGKLDDVVVLDRVSPQDYRFFVLDGKQERKQPTLMMKYSYYADSFQVEGIYVPFFKPSDVSYFGSGWSLFGRLQKAVLDSPCYSASQKATVSGIRIEDSPQYDENDARDGEGGLRVRGRIADVDAGAYYFSFHSRIPTLRENTANGNAVKRFLHVPTPVNLALLDALNPTGADLTLFKDYERVHMLGFDFETVVKECGVRGEVGLFFDLPYLSNDFSYTRKNVIMAGVGVDHRTHNNAYINLQFIETAILDYTPLFTQEEFSHELMLELSKEFLRGHLVWGFDCAFNISYSDWMLNPELRYTFNNGFEMAVGSFLFSGDLTTLFGRYAERDVIYLEGKYSF